MYSDDENESRKRWIFLALILLSLGCHFLLLLVLVLLRAYEPPPIVHRAPLQPPSITILPAAPQQQKRQAPELVVTQPDPGAKENPNARAQSENNTRLASHSPNKRDPLSIQPDIQGHPHTNQTTDSRYSPNKHAPVAPPAPKAAQQETTQVVLPPGPKTSPHPPVTPVPDQTPPPTTVTEALPTPAPPKPKPVKAPPPKQMVDANGLPVLPPLSATTLLPPETEPPHVQAQRSGEPPPSDPSVQGDTPGTTAIVDRTSVESRRTELGAYMAKVRRAIGSIWYPKVEGQMQLVSVGIVRLRVTIHADGTVDVVPLGGNNVSDSAMILRSISLRSIEEAAPFDRFPDSLKTQYGDSYTDEFTFQVYQE